MITQERIKTLFDYDYGCLYWKIKRPHIKVGDRAGYTQSKGYRAIKIDGKSYKEHHLIWLYHTGSLPKEQIDHINQIKDDNRIENLRECSNAENHQNRKLTAGVYKHTNGKWHARICINRKRVSLGYFQTKEEAEKVYLDAKSKYHPFFVSFQ